MKTLHACYQVRHILSQLDDQLKTMLKENGCDTEHKHSNSNRNGTSCSSALFKPQGELVHQLSRRILHAYDNLALVLCDEVNQNLREFVSSVFYQMTLLHTRVKSILTCIFTAWCCCYRYFINSHQFVRCAFVHRRSHLSFLFRRTQCIGEVHFCCGGGSVV